MVPIHDRPLTQFAKMRLRRYVEQQRAFERAHREALERAVVAGAALGPLQVISKDEGSSVIEFPTSPRKH